jgi:hypothetical protein
MGGWPFGSSKINITAHAHHILVTFVNNIGQIAIILIK